MFTTISLSHCPSSSRSWDAFCGGWPHRYRNVVDEDGICAIPRTECMKDVSRRVVGYWEEEIVPAVKSGKRVLVAVRQGHISLL